MTATAAAAPVASASAGLSAERRGQLQRRALWLAWASLGWMTIEGAVAITAGILAGSVALIGFGIDSVIEGLASVVIIWRFTGARLTSETAETRAQKLVAIQFFLLAPYVAIDATHALIAGEHPDISVLGMALTTGSLIFMPLFGVAKRRIGEELGSGATRGEGMQNILCAYLAAGVLAGLAANALFGLWWLDPVVALAIAAVAVREGREAWAGDDCGCAVPAGMLTSDSAESCSGDSCCTSGD